MILQKSLIDYIYNETKSKLSGVTINKQDLLEEINIFELTMKQVKNHPWKEKSVMTAHFDTNSTLYKKIQSSYVGDDPEEDYKQVIVWHLEGMLYITASVDHSPDYPLKWDVVVFNE